MEKWSQKEWILGSKRHTLLSSCPLKNNAPYNDEIFDDGVIEYQGHDVPKNITPDKKSVDQSMFNEPGTHTENGKFVAAATNYKEGKRDQAKIKVYRKIRPGV